jgi:hypothetical protein
MAQNEAVVGVHLLPELGSKKLDAVSTRSPALKHHLRLKVARTENNVLIH